MNVVDYKDILNHFPIRYLDYSNKKNISEISVDETVTIIGTISYIKNQFTRRGLKMQLGAVEDKTGKLTIVWFNQPYLTRTLYPGRQVAISGKVSLFSNQKSIMSPEYEILSDTHPLTHTGKIVPIYPETRGISSKRIRTMVIKAFTAKGETIKEIFPDKILKKYDLIDLKSAYKHIHFPESFEDALESKIRLAFNELTFLHLKSELRKSSLNKVKNLYKIGLESKDLNKFISTLPFKLTDSQTQVTNEIIKDFDSNSPMNRLLEGDVGSGKTVVAAIGMYSAFVNGFRSILMAPTQILANQHFETLKKLFKHTKIKISLVTAVSKKENIDQVDIVVGTHALLHKKKLPNNIAFVVIDEQHRFGVAQRESLIGKLSLPHTLTMTATPIPRTIALTLYGDLDLSVLKEMPKGRQKVTTWLVPPVKRNGAYKWIEDQVKNLKSQAFVVCPLIDESDKESMKDVKNVTNEYSRLKTLMPKVKFGLLHGKLKPTEKDEILNDFKKKKIDILVTTPVVEVGIDIPNTTIMCVEDAQRFGLAQLHQLRGRVGRGEKKSYCLLFSSIKTSKRLTAMTKTHSGFELAELDLKLRGPGEIFGTLQSGFPELKVASWSDIKLIEKTKNFAKEVIRSPQEFEVLLSSLNLSTIST